MLFKAHKYLLSFTKSSQMIILLVRQNPCNQILDLNDVKFNQDKVHSCTFCVNGMERDVAIQIVLESILVETFLTKMISR